MKVAHVRPSASASGASWELAAQLPDGRWLLLEQARAVLAADDARRAHNDALLRRPLTTLDAFLSERRGRLEALRGLLEPFVERPEMLATTSEEGGEAALDESQLRFGPPLLRPTSWRDFYAFEQHVTAALRRRGRDVPPEWYRMPIFYFGNVSEIRGPDDPVSAPPGCRELDYELELGAVVDTPIKDVSAAAADGAIGGYCVLNDWSARDLQREEMVVGLGPAKGKDFATSIGPWLVTPDELPPAAAGRKAPELVMTARVNDVETGRGSLADLSWSFGEMLERAARATQMVPGDLFASGTVGGGGCLMEIGTELTGGWLKPGDTVTLEIERVGTLTNPIVAPAGGRS